MVPVRKTITVSEETYNQLCTLGNMGDKWDDLLRRLYYLAKENQNGVELAIINDGSSKDIRPIIGPDNEYQKFKIKYESQKDSDNLIFKISGKCSESLANKIRLAITKYPEIQYSRRISFHGPSGYPQMRVKGRLLKFEYEPSEYLLYMVIDVKPEDYKI